MGERICKILSRNDTGETGGHQCGISIPKMVVSQGVLPELPREVLNPRRRLAFFDDNGRLWEFEYIYYNDLYHGKPRSKAHDEYRLTRVKDFLKDQQAKSGDEIWFSKEGQVLHIGIKHQQQDIKDGSSLAAEGDSIPYSNDVVVIHLGPNWKRIETKF